MTGKQMRAATKSTSLKNVFQERRTAENSHVLESSFPQSRLRTRCVIDDVDAVECYSE